MCIYDNIKGNDPLGLMWNRCVPNSPMSGYYQKRTGVLRPNDGIKRDFWNRWWNSKIMTIDGLDGWKAQSIYLKDIVKLLNNHKSTFGFKVLNEPEVFAIS